MKKPTTKKSKTSSSKKTKSSPSKTLWLHSAWPADVQVAFVPNESEWYRVLKKEYGITDEEYPTSDGRVTALTKDGAVHCLVTITDKKTSPEQLVGLIAHEAVHCYQKIKNWMKEQDPGIEFEAYTIGGLTQALISCYRQTRGGIKIA